MKQIIFISLIAILAVGTTSCSTSLYHTPKSPDRTASYGSSAYRRESERIKREYERELMRLRRARADEVEMVNRRSAERRRDYQRTLAKGRKKNQKYEQSVSKVVSKSNRDLAKDREKLRKIDLKYRREVEKLQRKMRSRQQDLDRRYGRGNSGFSLSFDINI